MSISRTMTFFDHNKYNSLHVKVALLAVAMGLLLIVKDHPYNPYNLYYKYVWPPSKDTIPGFCGLALTLFGLIYHQFFRFGDLPEWQRLRKERNKHVMLLMKQALEYETIQEEKRKNRENKTKDGKDEDKEDKRKEKDRPPSAKELFAMVFDFVEEQHVCDVGIPPEDPTYLACLELFKKQMRFELVEGMAITRKARDITYQITADDDVSLIHRHFDGTKLQDAYFLWNEKVQKYFPEKRFGVIVSKTELTEVKKYLDEIGAAQRRTMKILWGIIGPLLPMYIVGMIIFSWDSMTGPMMWHKTNSVLDKVQDGSMSLSDLGELLFFIGIKFVFCSICWVVGQSFANKATIELRCRLQNAMLATMMRQDVEYFDWHTTGVLQERLNNDATSLARHFFNVPKQILRCTCESISNMIAIWFISPEIFRLCIAPLPVLAFMQYKMGKYRARQYEKLTKMNEQTATMTDEMLKEIRTVREFAMELDEVDKYAACNGAKAQIAEFVRAVSELLGICGFWMFLGARLYSLYRGGEKMIEGEFTLGIVIQISFASMSCLHGVRRIMELVPELTKISRPLGRVCAVLGSDPKIEPKPGDKPKLIPETFLGEIEFKNVEFTFPTEPQKPVLKSFSFKAERGKQVALVGATGCGKSTSMQLIGRHYNVMAGEILLDGKNIEEYDVHWLRRTMSVVAQDNILFSTTIRENITYGIPKEDREKLTDEDLIRACRKANAWDNFIADFPRRLETYVGERGVKLSGGQKQRLAIARAIIRKPGILLLDEATSALDAKAEKVVQAALDRMIEANKSGCTILIAHRLTTIKNCDTIIVMDEGCKKEAGSHDELMAIPITKTDDGKVLTGWYHDLWNTQMDLNEDAEKQKAEDLSKEMDELRALVKKQAKELAAKDEQLNATEAKLAAMAAGPVQSSYLSTPTPPAPGGPKHRRSRTWHYGPPHDALGLLSTIRSASSPTSNATRPRPKGEEQPSELSVRCPPPDLHFPSAPTTPQLWKEHPVRKRAAFRDDLALLKVPRPSPSNLRPKEGSQSPMHQDSSSSDSEELPRPRSTAGARQRVT